MSDDTDAKILSSLKEILGQLKALTVVTETMIGATKHGEKNSMIAAQACLEIRNSVDALREKLCGPEPVYDPDRPIKAA